MCKSLWTPKQRLVLSDTLRAGGPRTKCKSSLAVSDTVDQQARWFCARSFKTAVGSRLKDSDASEGPAEKGASKDRAVQGGRGAAGDRRTLASDALQGSWPWTAPASHAHQGNAHRTMCKSPWTPKRRLVLSNTLRAGGLRKKWKSDPQAGTQ